MSKSTKDPAEKYDSNPFTLSFDALGRLFQTNLSWAIVLIVVGFFSFLAQIVSSVIDIATNKSSQTQNDIPISDLSIGSPDLPMIIGAVFIIFFIGLCFIVLATMIETFLKGMFSYAVLQSEKGKSVKFSESFNATSARFRNLFWSILLANIKILGWTLLLVVPGVIAALRYSLLPYLIMEQPAKKVSVKKTHDSVKSLVKGRLLEVLGVGTVAAIIPFVGYTIGIVGRGALYRQLQYSQKKSSQKPSIHWLNYTSVAIIGLLIVFVILAIGLSALLVALSS